MAEVHHTTLSPTKLELLRQWLPDQQWYEGGEPALSKAGGFRLDDPAGEVGIELLMVNDGPTSYLTPMTYRGAPLAGADHALVGTMEHGVLGRRWAYDAVHDPVFAAALVDLITGRARAQSQSESFTPDNTVAVDWHRPDRPRLLSSSGAGSEISIDTGTDPLRLQLRRLLVADATVDGVGSIQAGWVGQDGTPRRGPVVVALRSG